MQDFIFLHQVFVAAWNVLVNLQHKTFALILGFALPLKLPFLGLWHSQIFFALLRLNFASYHVYLETLAPARLALQVQIVNTLLCLNTLDFLVHHNSLILHVP